VIRYKLLCINKREKEITKVIGISALASMYHDGLIEGFIPPYIKEKIGLPRRKIRSDRIKPVIMKRDEWNGPDVLYFYPECVPNEWCPMSI